MTATQSPLSTEIISDLAPFIGGNTITFQYDEHGQCTRILGKDSKKVISSLSLAYKDGLLADVEMACQRTVVPDDLVPKLGRYLPGTGHIKYLYDTRLLMLVDGNLQLKKRRIIDGTLHKEYAYDSSGNLVKVTQNGLITRACTYQDNLLVNEKHPDGEELEYRYHDDKFISDRIIKKNNDIVTWIKYEFANGKVARIFQMFPNNKWDLMTLHIHNWDFGDIIVKDNVTRYYYGANGNLNLKIHVEDQVVRNRPFVLNNSLSASRIDSNMDVRNIELFLFDPEQSTGFLFSKNNGIPYCCQLLRYYKNGLLKTIETAPRSNFNNVSLLCMKPLGWKDICY